MQRAALILFLASANAYALGPEEEEFYGVTLSGEMQTLKYVSTNEEDRNGRRIYGTGTQKNKGLFCELVEKGMKCADSQSKVQPSLYRLVNEKEILFKDSVKPYANRGTGPGFAHSVYECTENCRGKFAKVYVVVSYGD